jgi:proteasome accessory factor A
MRPGRCLAERVGLARLVDPADVDRAMVVPPSDTRAYFRGRCLTKWPTSVVAANWDSIVFDAGHEPLQRVPMMEPLRGTATLVGSLIDRSDSVSDLLRLLDQHD